MSVTTKMPNKSTILGFILAFPFNWYLFSQIDQDSLDYWITFGIFSIIAIGFSYSVFEILKLIFNE